jgi:hypothetical protein
MPSRFVLKMLVIAMALAVAAFAGSSVASNGQPGPAPDSAIHTVLQPDLTLHSTLSRSLLPQDTYNLGKTTAGFCLGNCGSMRCTTNADCGPGGECRPFIICNDRQEKSSGMRALDYLPIGVKCTGLT